MTNQAMRRARIRAGYGTQEDAAEATGVPQGRLSAYESGREVPSASRARHLARCYRTTVWAIGYRIQAAGERVVARPGSESREEAWDRLEGLLEEVDGE